MHNCNCDCIVLNINNIGGAGIGCGGAIRADTMAGITRVEQNNFVGNRVNNSEGVGGGALCFLLQGGVVTFIQNTFERNQVGDANDFVRFLNNTDITLAASFGGAIYGDDARFGEISDIKFINNHAILGGAMFLSRSLVGAGMNRIQFNNNVAFQGGAFYGQEFFGPGLALNNISVQSNMAVGRTMNMNGTLLRPAAGGILLLGNRDVSLHNFEFLNNSVQGGNHGGGLFIQNSEVTSMRNGVFSNNYAPERGGGMVVLSPAEPEERVTVIRLVSNVSFVENIAGRHGGGAHLTLALVESLEDCRFLRNKAEFSGGGIDLFRSNLGTVKRTHFKENTVLGYGGGLAYWASTPSALVGLDTLPGVVLGNNGVSPRIHSCDFEDNIASNGGGMFLYESAADAIMNCSFERNLAVNLDQSEEELEQIFVADFFANLINGGTDAPSDGGVGGAIYLVGGLKLVSDTNFTSNEGAALLVRTSTTTRYVFNIGVFF